LTSMYPKQYNLERSLMEVKREGGAVWRRLDFWKIIPA
jgi:hypothetical protein